MRIQHNIMAMNAYRNYTNNVSAMQKNLEKLSSGYKINRAGDDAAGLAISEKMRAQITGLETAQKNAKDGISLVQTAEGALTEVHDMLNRMVTLATQSANGTYDNETDRAQLQKELDQLRSEINRIADSSNFNGIKLLDGSMDGNAELQFSGSDLITAQTQALDGQVASKAPAKGKYSVDLANASFTNVSTAAAKISFALLQGSSVTVELAVGETVSGQKLAEKIFNAISVASGDIGGNVTAVASKAVVQMDGITFNVSVEGSKLIFEMEDIPGKDFSVTRFDAKFYAYGGLAFGNGSSINCSQGEQVEVKTLQEAVTSASRVYAQATFMLSSASIVDGSAVKIGDETYVFAVGKDSKFADQVDSKNVIDLTDMKEGAIDLRQTVNRFSLATSDNKQFHVGVDVTTGRIALTEKEGAIDYNEYNLAGEDGKAVASGATGAHDGYKGWANLVQFGTATMKEAGGKSLMLQIGDTAEDFNQLKVNIKDMHTNSMGIGSISIADQDSAARAIDSIKSAINYVSDIRGTLGATQNRLDHTINNLSVMAENIQDAESTIRDTDVAEEMMAYTKNNILIQSAQAMLAQANQVPQGVLQLLQ